MANYTVNTLPENTKLIAHKILVKDNYGNKGQVTYLRAVSGTNPKMDKFDTYILKILEDCLGGILKHVENEFVPSTRSCAIMRKFLNLKYVAPFDVEIIQNRNAIVMGNQAGQSFSKYDLIFKIYSQSISTYKSFLNASYRTTIELENREWAEFADALDSTFCQYYDFFYDNSNKPYKY